MKLTKGLVPLIVVLLSVACNENEKEASPAKNTFPDSSARTLPPAPTDVYPTIDISPMDMSYFPVEYPKLKMTTNGLENTPDKPVVRVIYSRPHLGKRHLFRDLLVYGEPWRLGANESTEIEFYQPVTILGEKIKPSRYILYAIPQPDKWTIILNSNVDSWGLHPNPSKDIERFEIPVTATGTIQEYFTMVFEKTDTGTNLVIGWDSFVAKLPIKI